MYEIVLDVLIISTILLAFVAAFRSLERFFSDENDDDYCEYESTSRAMGVQCASESADSDRTVAHGRGRA